MRKRLALALLPVLIGMGGMGVLHAGPARAAAPPPPPPPSVAANTTYLACAGNYLINLGVCLPWTL